MLVTSLRSWISQVPKESKTNIGQTDLMSYMESRFRVAFDEYLSLLRRLGRFNIPSQLLSIKTYLENFSALSLYCKQVQLMMLTRLSISTIFL